MLCIASACETECVSGCRFHDRCKLEAVPEGISTLGTVEVVALDGSRGICDHPGHMDQWLSALAVLPRCHSLSLLSIGLDALTDEIAANSALASAPALRHLRCSAQLKEMPALEGARAAKGLPKLGSSYSADRGAPGEVEAWERYRALMSPPSVNYGPCRVLTSPQLDDSPCF